MKTSQLMFAFACTFLATGAFAHGDEKHDSTAIEPGRDVAQAQLNIAPEAADAVATVERFGLALSAGDLDAMRAELDPSVLILESGGVERSRDEYFSGHASSDADFIKAAHVMLRQRTAQASGDLAWVASESDIHATKKDTMLQVASTETMILRRVDQAWRIVHIHWSSRRISE